MRLCCLFERLRSRLEDDDRVPSRGQPRLGGLTPPPPPPWLATASQKWLGGNLAKIKENEEKTATLGVPRGASHHLLTCGWRAPGKQPKYVAIVPPLLTHGMGMGMGLQGWGGSATFQEHPYLILQVALPSEPPIKTKNTRITALDVCSTANVVVTDVNLRVHNCPQSEIYTIHTILPHTPRIGDIILRS